MKTVDIDNTSLFSPIKKCNYANKLHSQYYPDVIIVDISFLNKLKSVENLPNISYLES